MRALIIEALEEKYGKQQKGTYVTGPMIKRKGGKLGPLFPTDEDPHDLVFFLTWQDADENLRDCLLRAGVLKECGCVSALSKSLTESLASVASNTVKTALVRAFSCS